MEATLPLLRINQELQLNCREIILNNQLNSSWREALSPRTDRRNNFTTMRLIGSVEEAQEGWLSSHRWLLKIRRDISGAVGSPEKCGV